MGSVGPLAIHAILRDAPGDGGQISAGSSERAVLLAGSSDALHDPCARCLSPIMMREPRNAIEHPASSRAPLDETGTETVEPTWEYPKLALRSAGVQ